MLKIVPCRQKLLGSASVVERVPLASKIDLSNVISFQMCKVEIRKLRTAKGAIGWPLSLLALWIVEQDRQFPIRIEDDESVYHRQGDDQVSFGVKGHSVWESAEIFAKDLGLPKGAVFALRHAHAVILGRLQHIHRFLPGVDGCAVGKVQPGCDHIPTAIRP